ncbi:MAG: abortive infection family protein [Solirubrobacterales bacterium]
MRQVLTRVTGGKIADELDLQLAPGTYSEEAFKQILGGCNSVVVGLGRLRNKVGDTHGSGRRAYRPSDRHAPIGPTC